MNLYPTTADVEVMVASCADADQAISLLIGHSRALRAAGADEHAVALVAREAQRICQAQIHALIAGRDPRGLDAEMLAAFPAADYADHIMEQFADAAAICAQA